MQAAPELFPAIRRRARGLAAVSRGASFLAATAPAAFLAALIWHFVQGPLPAGVLAAVLAAPGLAVLVGAGDGFRRRLHLPAVLLRIDQRLGWDARLSSLYELERQGRDDACTARLRADLQSQGRRWRPALRLAPRSALFIAVGLLCLAGTMTLHAISTPDYGAGLAEARAGAGTSGAESSGDPETPLGSAPPVDRTTDMGSESGHASTPVRQHTLAEILAELRPANTSSQPAGVPGIEAPTEGGMSAPLFQGGTPLRQALESLDARIDAVPGPLSTEERAVLEGLLPAASPDEAQGVEGLLAAEDLDTLRQQLAQLLDPRSAAAEQQGVSRIQDVDDPPETDSEADGTPPDGSVSVAAVSPGDASSGGDESATSDGTAASPSGVYSETTDEPIFDQPLDAVTAISPPATLGNEGGYTDYLTMGVPASAAPADDGGKEEIALDFRRVDSVLASRSLPEGAAATIRDYFQRITEETP